MSRSRRKTPIFGVAAARSEREDKVIWHGRLRAAERDAIARASSRGPDGLERHVATPVEAVSNPWSMAKDGRVYRSQARREAAAAAKAARLASPAQRLAAVVRSLRKSMAK